MGVDLTALIGGAVGGAAVQSVLGPLFGQRHLRRDLRANVLRGIAQLESKRWSDSSFDEFLEALVGLRAAVLVAGLPSGPAEAYIEAAGGARAFSEHKAKEAPPETAGFIPKVIGELVQLAAADLVDLAWHPYRSRPFLKRCQRRFEAQKDSTTASLIEDGDTWFVWERVRISG